VKRQPTYDPVQNDAFYRALVLAVFFHSAVLALILFPGQHRPPLVPLGSMIFDYDPLGGEPGGGEGAPVKAEAPSEPPPAEEPAPEPVPEPEPEPEPVQEEDLSLIESAAPEAPETMAPPPPPPPEPKPKPRTRPRPKPPAPAQAAAPVGNPDLLNPGSGTGTGGGEGSGRGGYGGGTGQGTSDVMAGYMAQIRRKLERYRKYPPSARHDRIEGTVTMRFTLNRQGEVVSARMVGSSGFQILDDEAQALIRRVNPLPRFPKELEGNTLDFTVPIQFALR
jgi:protein TonB